MLARGKKLTMSKKEKGQLQTEPVPEVADVEPVTNTEKKPARKVKDLAKILRKYVTDLAYRKKLSGWKHGALRLAGNKKFRIVLAVIILLGVIDLAVPVTRYISLGILVTQPVSFELIDSVTSQPVTEARITIGSQSAVTDKNGRATLSSVHLGLHTLYITKAYYKDYSSSFLVGGQAVNSFESLNLISTGRQVIVSVLNKVSNGPVGNALIDAGKSKARTAKDGTAIIVLPANAKQVAAKVSANGFNESQVKITVGGSATDNTYTITPAGKVYFLSRLSGKIDVVKTNLDGTDRQTVLAGTGTEDQYNTVMLASRDWKYLALISRRDGSDKPSKLYLIETATDTVSTMDEGTATFAPIGWSDSTFVYQVSRYTVTSGHPRTQALKSFNAATKTLKTLDETDGQGDFYNGTYIYTLDGNYSLTEYYTGGFYLVGNKVLYAKSWSYDGCYYDKLPSKHAGIYLSNVDGSKTQMLRSFAYPSVQSSYCWYSGYVPNYYFETAIGEPNEILFRVQGGGNPAYFTYANGSLTQGNATTLDADFSKYQQSSITYLQSPSGNYTFWSDERDGQKLLFIGDEDGKNAKNIATLSGVATYGWYGDDYLLISKNGSELYILPRSGVADDKQLIKVSDYHKPAQSFYGYGGGYGGN